MSVRKKVLVLFSKSKEEVFNRKSALGAQVLCVSELIQSGNTDVYINGELLSDHLIKKYQQAEAVRSQSKIKKLIKSVVPKNVKRYLRDYVIFSGMKKFSKTILEENVKYDCILEFYTLGSDTGLTVSKKLNAPLYVLYDNSMEQEYMFFNNNNKPFFNRQLKTIELNTLLQSKKIIIYSPAMREYLIKLTGNKLDPSVFVYHQNVDFSRLDWNEEKANKVKNVIHIGFIGSFLKWHQVDMLVEVFEFVFQQGINAELHLLGSGVEFDSIQKMVAKSPAKDKIHLYGFLDGEKLKEVKEKINIGVLPGSNWYNAPNKLFEYGAMKMACIAPNTPTVEFIFQNEEVVLFKWKDIESFQEELLELCLDHEMINNKAETIFNFVKENYNIEDATKFYRSLLETN